MMEIEAKIKWLEVDVIPKVIESVNKQRKNYKCLWTPLDDCYFLSEILFADIIFENNDEDQNSVLHLVLKILPELRGEPSRKFYMNKFYQNEIIFYKKVAEYFPNLPRYFYGTADDIDKTVIVLENICKRGFKMCPQLYDIPMKYVFYGVRELGKFHGMGYVMKERHPEKFADVVKELQEGRLIFGQWLHKVVDFVGPRPVEWLRKVNYDPAFCDKMDKCLSNAFASIMLDTVKPTEPLAVLLHGDFTRSNMLFKETRSEVDTMLIDFGMIRYGSPAIDLSTLLFLNTSTEGRRDRFDEILKAYHDSLLEYLRDAGSTDFEKYSFQNILVDYKRRAVYGYIVALFFLPTLCGFCDNDETTGEDNQIEEDPIEMAKKIKAGGGDMMSAKFADILLELRSTGCLDHLL